MASLVSIRLDDHLFQEMKTHARCLNLSRSDYIRKAIEHMNEDAGAQQRKHRLTQASLRVRKESLRVNAEFSEVDHDPEA